MDKNPRGKKAEHSRENKAHVHAGLELPERVCYRERSNVERAFKHSRMSLVHAIYGYGASESNLPLMSRILALTLDQLMCLAL